MKKILPYVLLLLVVVAMGIKLKSNKKAAADKVYQADQSAPVPVRLDTVQARAFTDEKQYTGTFEANRETKISAEIQGGIRDMRVEAGSVVQKGQVLVQLDQTMLQHQLEGVAVQLANAQADVERFKVLAAADAIQAVQYEKAQLALQGLLVQQASLKTQLEKTSIKAPFSGVVTAKFAEIGGFAAPGQPLLVMAELQPLKFLVMVPEADLQRFQKTEGWRIKVDAHPNLLLQPLSVLNNSQANPANLFSLRFTVPNTPDQKLKAGMFGKLSWQHPSVEAVLQIPASALVGSTTDPQVYVADGGKARLRSVKTGRNHAGWVEITTGLQAGELIVSNGLVNVFDGATLSSKP